MFELSYSVLASDMDITYHITPNAIMLYFQDCFARFLTSKRLAAFDVIKDGLIWIISDLEMKYVNERPLWSSSIKVKIRFREIASVRMYVDYWITNEDDVVFAEGTSVWAILNSETKRPFGAKELLATHGITDSGEFHQNIPVPDTSNKKLSKEVEHVVNVTDLDFNGHVCNRSYLSISMATFPLEFIKTYSPKYIHIKFTREAFFGETLKCQVSKDENQTYWFDILNSKGKAICNVYSEWEDNHEVLSRNISEMIKR